VREQRHPLPISYDVFFSSQGWRMVQGWVYKKGIDMKSIKTTEKNRIVLKKLLDMAPSVIKIVEDISSDITVYENMLSVYVEEATAFQDRINFLEAENRKMEEEIRLLKTVH